MDNNKTSKLKKNRINFSYNNVEIFQSKTDIEFKVFKKILNIFKQTTKRIY
jgi:hypothetical protein